MSRSLTAAARTRYAPHALCVLWGSVGSHTAAERFVEAVAGRWERSALDLEEQLRARAPALSWSERPVVRNSREPPAVDREERPHARTPAPSRSERPVVRPVVRNSRGPRVRRAAGRETPQNELEEKRVDPEAGSPLSPGVQAYNHDPDNTWDPMVDYAMMSRNVRHYMSLFHSDKPVVCKVHGYCVAGGTDMALCSDLLVIQDTAKIGYPPARVWGSPTTAIWAYRIGIEKAKRLLFTGDCLSGKEAVEWGLAIECAPREELDERFQILLDRIARQPVNQLMMMKLLVNQTVSNMGLNSTQILGTVFDGITRHTREGYNFQRLAQAEGFREAVRQRDEPMGDLGLSTYKDKPHDE